MCLAYVVVGGTLFHFALCLARALLHALCDWHTHVIESHDIDGNYYYRKLHVSGWTGGGVGPKRGRPSGIPSYRIGWPLPVKWVGRRRVAVHYYFCYYYCLILVVLVPVVVEVTGSNSTSITVVLRTVEWW